ncbi:hypothetical protein ACPCSE_29250 [Streptomyces cellulosae]
MSTLPTLAETLAVRPEQLTGLTPAEVDRYNAVLGAELARLAAESDRAADRLHGALLERKTTVRSGRGHARVWPTTLEQAERTARQHLRTGYEPDQMTRIQSGLYKDGVYAEKLSEALGNLDFLRAELRRILDGPAAVLDAEFTRRGGWSRMYLCLSDGGHIHSGRQCPSIGPRTELAWLPEVSGMDWREAYREVIAKRMAGATQAIMCTKCYPDAPTEWTEKQADPGECPGSRQHVELDASMARRASKYAECPVCGEKVSVTSTWKLRKHDRPEGGEEAKPEAPAPQPPAADTPKGDGIVVIERRPQAEPAPAPAAEGKPGTVPTQMTVLRLLKSAGFQVSRYTEARSQSVPTGAKVAPAHRGAVSVHWNEGDGNFFDRMTRLGVTDVRDVPEHPQAREYAQAYAEALAPRYAVQVEEDRVYVSARATLPPRPKGVPRAAQVRRAFAEAQVPTASVYVIDQPDHTRVSVTDEARVPAVREALTAQGWTFEESENWQHVILKVTGSTPDRPALLRALRAQKTEERPQQAAEEAPEPARQEAPAPAVEEPQRAEAPAPEAPPAPARYADGRRWEVGQRITWRSRDGFLFSGRVTGFDGTDAEPRVKFEAETRQIAPARPVRGVPARPAKVTRLDPPKPLTVAIDRRVSPA